MTKRALIRGSAPLLVLSLAACGAAATPTPSNNVIAVAETPATNGTIASVLSYSGSVNPAWTISVLPQTSGTVTDLKVKAGQQLKQGDVIAVLDHRTQDDQLVTAQANLSSAQAKLNSMLAGARPEDIAAANAQAAAAQAAVQNLQSGRPEAVNQAQANLDAANARLAQAQNGGRAESIAQAQAKLNADQAALQKLQNGPTPQAVAQAQLAIELAKDKLYADQVNDDALVGHGAMTKDARQAALDADQTGIDQANAALAALTAPPRPEDVAQAKAAVDADTQALSMAQQPNTGADLAALQATVAQAQATLDQAKQPGSNAAIAQAQQQASAARATAAKTASPYTDTDIAQAKAGVDVAQASVQSAQTAVDNATVTAPTAAVVSEVPVAVGSLVSPQTPIATLIAPILEVDASVDQSQITAFQQGQQATISGVGSNAVKGTVTEIDPAADAKTRKFTVKVTPDSGSPLRSGMSVTVNIQTGQQANALLVLKDAVIQKNGQQVVFTDENGRAKMNVVQTGFSNDTQTQIVSGLSAGAKVILPGSLNLADGDAVAAAPGPAAASASAAASTSPSASASASK
ncbi:MAG: efflux RND transporter periplasmic adaptor subunit [Chloroflexi bacterium]|nr:efflux RND transporter periplasmic adaptor subunit [Chloroflexota bacterium]